MRLSKLATGNTSRVSTDAFLGYKHKLLIADGEMYDTQNMSTDEYPLLSVRKPRGVVKTLTNPGGMIEKNALVYVDGGTLYVDGEATSMTGLSAGEKQIVGMGAYVVVFPDRLYYNLEDPSDTGSLDAFFSASGSISYAPADIDGNVYTNVTVSDTAPENPANGDCWLDSSADVFYQWSVIQTTWIKLESVYTRVTLPGDSLTGVFSTGDTVDIEGLAYDVLNGQKYLYGAGEHFVLLLGLTGAESTEEGTVSVRRTAPAMDYVIECSNRLWGCFYGVVDGQTVNELYCSKLGDFKNWRVYQGLSTDSWAASVGSDGPWTGAINYRGYPTFFKENRVHSITVSATGAHRVDETVCRGVQRGSAKSLVVVGETLYYKSRFDVCAWQGGMPVGVSDALGDELYAGAVAGALGSKYYISMLALDGTPHLFVYDISLGLWMHEDSLRARYFCAVGNELYCIDSGRRLLSMLGTQGTKEPFTWAMETGTMFYAQPGKKYVSRYDVRLSMTEGATLTVYMQYDSSGEWIESGSIKRKGLGSVVVPIRPRRCDHLRMRLVGSGDVKVYSITRILEVGSDV